MPTTYDVDVTDAAAPVIRRDGAVVDVKLAFHETLEVPGFVGVYVDDVRQHDVEVWVAGELKASVPARSPAVDARYDQLEASARQG